MEKKRMINLKEVEVPNIDGTSVKIDVSKDVASITYNSTQDLEVVSACLELFKNGQCAYTDKIKEDLVKTVNNLVRMVDGEAIPMGIVMKKAILDAIG